MCSYGGTDVLPDLERLQSPAEWPQVLVGTPGRMNLLLNRMPEGWLDQVDMLVLDEADRMLDMGFEEQIRTVITRLPVQRQTLFFTATWPKSVNLLAEEYLRQPVRLNIGQTSELNANRSVHQLVEVVSESSKLGRLQGLLAEHGYEGCRSPASKALVFVNTKKDAARLSEMLQAGGLEVDCIHGNRPQHERESVMAAFSAGRRKIMVATDLAGRGIDVKDVSLVVNYDMPTSTGQQCMEDYVHRIGRTGRMDIAGTAVTLFEPKIDVKVAHELVKVLQNAGQAVPAELAALDTGESVLNAAQKRGLEKSSKKRLWMGGKGNKGDECGRGKQGGKGSKGSKEGKGSRGSKGGQGSKGTKAS